MSQVNDDNTIHINKLSLINQAAGNELNTRVISNSASNVNLSPTPGSSSIACSVSPSSRAPSTERATNASAYWARKRGAASRPPERCSNQKPDKERNGHSTCTITLQYFHCPRSHRESVCITLPAWPRRAAERWASGPPRPAPVLPPATASRFGLNSLI